MKWTEELDDMLLRANAYGIVQAEIARRLSRSTDCAVTVNMVRNRLATLDVAPAGSPGPSRWTPDRVETLKQLRGQGLSASQIATRLGVGFTRNSVISKMHRIGLSSPAAPRKRGGMAAAAKRRAAAKRAASVHRRMVTARATLAERLASLPVETLPPAAPDLEPLVASLAELDPNHCRYTGDDKAFRFCGREKLPGLSWCAHHARKVFAVAPTVARVSPEKPAERVA